MWGHVTLATLPFRKFLRGHVRTVPGNMHVKFENWSDWPVRCVRARAHTHTHTQTDRQTDRHTSNEHIISAIHFVYLAEINMLSNAVEGLLWNSNVVFMHDIRPTCNSEECALSEKKKMRRRKIAKNITYWSVDSLALSAAPFRSAFESTTPRELLRAQEVGTSGWRRRRWRWRGDDGANAAAIPDIFVQTAQC